MRSLVMTGLAVESVGAVISKALAKPMLVACAIAVLSVLLGAAVGFSRRIGDRHLGPVRTFAFAAALAVVFGQFLPDAFDGMGIEAALPFAIGVVGPWLLERLTMRASRSSRSLGLEIGYLGLLIHQLGDGIGMGAYAGPLHEGHRHIDLFLAIGGHTVPVAAMVVVAFLRVKGPRVAAVRAAGLALFVLLGVGAARYVSVELVERHHATISALVAGLLLHIATDDMRANAPRSARDRGLDLLAGAAGLGMVLAMSTGHEHEHAHAALASRELVHHAEALPIFSDLALRIAPILLVGLVGAAALQAVVERAVTGSFLRGGSSLARGVKGLGVGIGIRGTTTGLLAASRWLLARGAGSSFVGAFLLATMMLGLDGLLLSAQLLGGGLTIVRAAASVVAALLVAMLLRGQAAMHGVASDRPTVPEDLATIPDGAHAEPRAARAARLLDELTYHSVPWMLLGLFAASYVAATVDASDLAAMSPIVSATVVLVVLTMMSSASLAAAVPMAAVLIARGAAPSVVVAGLVLGPVASPAVIGTIRKLYGDRSIMRLAISVALSATLAGALAYAVGLDDAHAAAPGASPRGAAAYVSLVALAALVMGACYRRGVRGFFASLFEPQGAGPHDEGTHAHDHRHDPFHGDVGEPSEVQLSAPGH